VAKEQELQSENTAEGKSIAVDAVEVEDSSKEEEVSSPDFSPEDC
jgi:hypothetical protein